MKRRTAINVIGWYGAMAILTAYGLSSLGILKPNELLFQILNLTGALGLLSVALHHRTSQLAFINVVWAIIAAISIVNIWL